MATVARGLALAVAMSALCSCVGGVLIEANPVTIGPEPIEVVLSPALQTGGRTNKGIWAPLDVQAIADLPLRGGSRDPQSQRELGIYYRDGRREKATAFILLEGGEIITLEGNVGRCDRLDVDCYLNFELDVYRSIRIEKIRFVATAPVRVKRIEWKEGIPK